MIEGMIQLTEPQIWTLVGVFAASMFGMLRMVNKSFADLLRAEIGSVRAELRSEIGGLRSEMTARFEAQDVKLDQVRAEMNARFDAQDTKLGYLDRDVQAVVRRVFPDYPDAS